MVNSHTLMKQMMYSKRAGVLLASVLIYLRLMQNTFVWLYWMLFRCHRNVMTDCLLMLLSCSIHRFRMRVRNRDMVAASCVSPNAMLSSPLSFLIYVLLQVCVTSCHKHMHTLVRAAILWLREFTCLYIYIKIGVCHLGQYDYACCDYELNRII